MAGVSSANQRGRGGGAASGSMAITSRKLSGPIFSSRLWVPMAACLPPATGATPITDSIHAEPSSSVRAATMKWSNCVLNPG